VGTKVSGQVATSKRTHTSSQRLSVDITAVQVSGRALPITVGGRKYLSAIDLPVSERKQVVQELGYMGITAGSLFPGLDGACEELRERYSE
jgi:hypothetical protein